MLVVDFLLILLHQQRLYKAVRTCALSDLPKELSALFPGSHMLSSTSHCSTRVQWDHQVVASRWRMRIASLWMHHPTISATKETYSWKLTVSPRWLAKKGYKSVWAVGRHILGSQIFDYWWGPTGFMVDSRVARRRAQSQGCALSQ